MRSENNNLEIDGIRWTVNTPKSPRPRLGRAEECGTRAGQWKEPSG
jgi:hypothetical protein